MKIAVDVRSLMEGRHSGVEEYTSQIVLGLKRVAPQHTWQLFYNAAREVKLPEWAKNFPVISFRYPNKLFNLTQFLAQAPKWDKLISADCFFMPHMRLLPLSTNVPLVACVHDLSFEHFPEFFSWRRRAWHYFMQPRQMIEKARAIVTVSEATKDDVINLYGVAAEKVAVVYSGVRITSRQYGGQAPQQLKKYKLPEKYILYLGTLEPRKNVASIIKAFDSIAESIAQDLVIAGARGWLMRELDRAYNSAKYKARIKFLGFIPETDKTALYAAADLFVYPSLYEGFGFPPLEALLAGTPVITSYNSSLPEIVGPWATLVNPDDTGELALVMRELLDDLPEVSQKIRHLIQNKYDWDRAAQQTLKVIERAAGQ